MFGFIKNLLRRQNTESVAGQHTPGGGHIQSESHHAPGSAGAYSANPPQRQMSTARRSAVGYSNGNGNGHANGNGNGSHKGVEIPLESVLALLPLEIQPLVVNGEFSDRTINVPLEKVLAQLSRGSVKISFADLRAAAPDVFAEDFSHDRVMVPLPLGEILTRLNPALIQRRRTQKQVEIPQDIASPFDLQAQGLGYNAPAPEPEPLSVAAAPAPRPALPVNQPGPGRKFIASAPAPQPPTVLSPGAPVLSPSRMALSGSPAPVPFNTTAAPAPVAASTPASPAPAAAPAVPRPAMGEPIIVPLTALAESWPEAVRKEVVSLNLVDAKVALPADQIEQALKQGRIAFTWKALRSWIRPTPLPVVSAHDSAVLELPLKAVAPLFIARQKEQQRTQNKVSIDAEIPNLFFGLPQGASADVAVARPADTNFYVWDDSGDSVRTAESEVRRGPSPDTRFVAKYATPNEIVSRAAALDHVAGSLIALPDGLMVANRLPADLNPDTVAAFLPQIFGKMSTCTKELRMGELNNLNFTVGNVPWKIFRVNAIFFAAFGRAGEPLPTAELAALAAELDHKPR